MLIIYFIAATLIGIHWAYTSKFQEASHHWGRILAGQKSLQSEINEIAEQENDPSKKGSAMGYAKGYAIYQSGFQDAITPRMQNIRNVILFIAIPAIIIIGFIYFKWYIPLIALVVVFLLYSNVRDLFPPLNSDFFKKKIIYGLKNRLKWFNWTNNYMKAEAAEYFIEKLEDSTSDVK